jgi:hypothetical protein
VLSALLPALVLAAVAVAGATRYVQRRRLARMKISGGRKSLALNLMERGRL